MQFIKDMKIGVRMGLGFGVVILAGLAVAIYGRLALTQIGEELSIMADDRVVKVNKVRDVKDNVNEIARSVRNIALMTDAQQKQAEVASINANKADNAKLIQQLEDQIAHEKGKALLRASAEARSRFNPLLDQSIALALQGKTDEARELLMGPVREAQLAYMQSLDALVAFQVELMNESKKAAQQSVAQDAMLMLVVSALAAVLGAAVAWLVAGSIARPLREAVEVTGRIAQGDLTNAIEVRSADEVGALLRALKGMQDNLSEIVGKVRSGVESVSTASGQIAAGNQDLSSRTEQQASNLQETAASMEQLTSAVRQSTDNAKQANQLALAANQAATQGGSVVGQVVATMEEITASSRKIADIIAVIDGIAFQTNILALNAAVEAARAGEQGRGFAVVAGEVRNLAQRSAQAAREIKTLINDSVEKVDAGSRLVGTAGSAMGEIVSQAKRVADLIGEITSTSVEQSSGIDQVNDAVSQMDQVTQQNAALVEESAAAASSLRDQAEKLAEAVSVFKLSQGETRRAIEQAQARAQGKLPAPKAAPAAARKRTEPKLAARGEPARPAAAAARADGDWQEF